MVNIMNTVRPQAGGTSAKRPVVVGFVVLTMLAVLAVGLAAPAAAKQGGYPPGMCAQLSVSTTAPSPGQEILVTGSGFDANRTVTLVLHSPTATLGTATTGSAGNFAVRVTIPDSISGAHLLTVEGGSAGCPAAGIQLFVQPPGVAAVEAHSPSGAPAATGVGIAAGLALALALIVGGLLFARAGRGRTIERHVS
ncbi:MAG: hypothetical protein ABR571_00240 [Jatrophihabitans sp.]|uniref:hypothetical protein n=1 Tax=Jatrophihabitans sp. TaxID=1932789 RepID=UPI0039168FEE